MKRYIIAVLTMTLLLSPVAARCLVITLKSGQRMAFQLDETSVVMTHTDTQLTFNGLSIDRENIQEFRIHEETPKDAIAVGIQNVRGEKNESDYAIFDLSGRRVNSLRLGIYVINHRKVVIR